MRSAVSDGFGRRGPLRQQALANVACRCNARHPGARGGALLIGLRSKMINALYFPHLTLPDASWINPSLLFFDQLQLIAPLDARSRLFDERTNELIDVGYVRPTYPGSFGWDHASDERFTEAVARLPQGRRRAVEPTRIHMGKLEQSRLSRGLQDLGLLHREGRDWFVGPRWLAGELLTYLALQIAQRSPDAPALVTDEGPAWTAATGMNALSRRRSRELAAIASLLPVSPAAEIRTILSFKDRHAGELSAFRDRVSELSAIGLASVGGDMEFAAQLSDARQQRDELSRRLEERSLLSSAIAVSLAALPLGAAILEGSPWTAGAAYVALGATAFTAGRRARREHEMLHDPLVYAALAKLRL